MVFHYRSALYGVRVAVLLGAAWPTLATAQNTARTAWDASRTVSSNDMVTTGVAKGRDRLDSATSTSTLPENEIVKLAPRTLADLLRNVPGIRVEAAAGEGGNGYTVRGLPMVSDGAKFLQIQEDGLPVMEFGDLFESKIDNFVRADLNLAQIESIRGGSASTFASNAPGGVINLISKTGEVEGGSVQVSGGLDYDSRRVDLDYGAHLGGGWRFHIGGFYRSGEGPRDVGYTAYRGGQVKLNVTREFDGGYIRFYGKLLDDVAPRYLQYPVQVTGSDAKPEYANVPGFPLLDNTLQSTFITTNRSLSPEGRSEDYRYRDGVHAKAKSGGIEMRVDLAGWTVTERFRYSAMSNRNGLIFPSFAGTPAQTGAALGIPNPRFTYADGPLRGAAFDPARGSGLLSVVIGANVSAPDVSSMTNDLRATRVWNTGIGSLTTTAGLYASRQDYDSTMTLTTFVQDVQRDGKSSILNVSSGPFPVTQGGYLLYDNPGTSATRTSNVSYDILAPYGSFNLQRGRVAIGGSLRYDVNRVDGDVGTSRRGCFDFNRDGVTAPGSAECTTALFPADLRRPIDYNDGYLSFSTGVNVRLAEPLAVFARYSSGGRAAGDALLLSPAISPTTGDLVDKSAGHDSVRQAEAGVKFRKNGMTLNVTVFHAKTRETTNQTNQDENGVSQIAIVSRNARAYGAEIEGGLRRGPFSVTASGTLVDAEITKAESVTLVGNTPRHQPTLVYQMTPQYDVDRWTIGTNIVGVTGSYAQDINQLRLPAYVTVGAFLQVRPVDRVELSLNASNLFNERAITETLEARLPATNVVLGRTLFGRTISVSGRFFY